MNELDLLSVAADGMGVQRTLLDVAARNVAAAQASTPQHPYPRLVARFMADDADGRFAADDSGAAFAAAEPMERLAAADPAGAFIDAADGGEDDPGGTRFAGTVRSGETADALTEMIAVLDAQRAYEANASVFDVGKKLADRTLDVGRT
jgi:flagellar basal-body rod protein FlgC